MAFKKNNPGCNCCDFTCLIESDDFDRADSDTLGSKWVEKTGDWDISSNTLVSTTDGVVLTSARQGLPVGSTYNYQVRVTLLDTSSTWGIICKYTDASNFDWIEVVIVSGNYLPKFWRRTGGVDALIMDITTHPAGSTLASGATSPPVTVCYSEVEWSISGGPSIWTTCNCTAPTALPADTTVGFVGFLKGDVDDFEYYYHKISKTDCVQCACYCSNPGDATDNKCVPETLTLTLTPVVNHPDCTGSPTTLTYTLRQSVPIENDPPPATYTKSPLKFNWYSDPVDLYEPGQTDRHFWFRLRCLGGGLFELAMLEYPGMGTFPGNLVQFQVQDGPNGGALNTAVECTPIVLTFPRLEKFLLQIGSGGPFSCNPFDGREYTAVVTE